MRLAIFIRHQNVDGDRSARNIAPERAVAVLGFQVWGALRGGGQSSVWYGGLVLNLRNILKYENRLIYIYIYTYIYIYV